MQLMQRKKNRTLMTLIKQINADKIKSFFYHNHQRYQRSINFCIVVYKKADYLQVNFDNHT